MSLSIDDIYDLFEWDASYTTEEYDARVKLGITEAGKLKYLFPFLQPIIPGKGKSVWEPCAKVIACRSDDELEPYFYSLFCWLQDMNWPGADIIFNRLCQIPFSRLDGDFRVSKHQANRMNDQIWSMYLDEFQEHHPFQDNILDSSSKELI